MSYLLSVDILIFLQDDGSRIYAWIMYDNFGRELLCKVSYWLTASPTSDCNAC